MIFSEEPIIRLAAKIGKEEAAKKLKIEVSDLEEQILAIKGQYDSLFFEKKFLKIQTKSGQLVPFEPNPVQMKLQAEIDKQRSMGKPVRIKIPKARRHGISTKVQSVFYRDGVFGSHLKFLTVCHDLEASMNMRGMFERYHEHFPLGAGVKPQMTKPTTKTWRFKKQDIDYLIDTADELDTGRSFTIHRLHLSEVAFYRDPDTLMTGLLRAVDKNANTMIIAESTANGMGGWWYDFVTRDNEYARLFFAWFEDAGNQDYFVDDQEKIKFEHSLNDYEKQVRQTYGLTLEQLHWRRKEIENGFNGNEDMFRQEYPSNLEESFVTSGRQYFPISKIREQIVRTEKIQVRNAYLEWEAYGERVNVLYDRNGFWKIFEEPKTDFEYRYITGSDPAEGKSSTENNKDPDYSCCVVKDRITKSVSAVFRARVDTDAFEDEIYKAIILYGSCVDVVERNNTAGGAIIKGLKDKSGVNLYRKELQGKIEDGETVEFGWTTNKETREMLLSDFRRAVKEKEFISDDIDLWKECSTFIVDKTGKPIAMSGRHDDMIFASAMTIQGESQAVEMTPVKKVEEEAPRQHDTLDAWEKKHLISEMDYAEF